MEQLKNQIRDKFNSVGWTKKEDSDLWYKEEEITMNQGTIYVNGQPVKQEGQKHKLRHEFEILYECPIKDIYTNKEDITLMCSFKVTDNDNVMSHIEINVYPNEIDYINRLATKLFNI